MASQNAVQKAVQSNDTQVGKSLVTQIRDCVSGSGVRKKFYEIMGEKAAQYMASIVNIAAKFPEGTDPNSIMAAAFVGATYDLPIDSNLGFSAIVPYNGSYYNPQTRQYESKKEAQFQIMYKGFIQLAIRSGQYEKMNCSEVYQDELKSYNPITGELEFVDDFTNCTDRDNGDDDKIVGYYAWFKLKTGFSHELFMTTQSVTAHAKKYSQSYRNDLNKNKKASPWSTNFKAMALKTVIKLLLSKWGILSVDMQRAVEDDQKIFDKDGNSDYGDNKQEEIIDVTPQEITDPFAQNAVSEDETPEATQNPTEENKTQPEQSQEVTDTSQATSKAEVEKTTTAAAGVGEPPSMYDAEQVDIDLAGLGA